MKKTPTNAQDLRRKIYIKAKAEKEHRFWGLYVHVCKIEILGKAYSQAKQNNGAPGIDGVTFEAIEKGGVTEFLKGIQQELLERRYKPMATRKHAIPKNNGKVRILGIPTIRDRVVQGALKLVLEPIFEADFKDGSYGYRPKRSPHQAIESMKQAILMGKTQIIDLDIRAYFDSVRHDLLFKKVAGRVNDDEIMSLLKAICKASGKRGIPQGGPLSPLLANIFLNGIDEMLEEAKKTTQWNSYTNVGYVRFADDLVVLIHGHPAEHRLINPLFERLREELTKLDLQVNDEKTKIVDLEKGKLRLPRIRRKTRESTKRENATPNNTEERSEKQAGNQSKRYMQKIYITTHRKSNRTHKPNNKRMGKLLQIRQFGKMLQQYKKMDREQSTKAPSKSQRKERIRLEKME